MSDNENPFSRIPVGGVPRGAVPLPSQYGQPGSTPAARSIHGPTRGTGTATTENTALTSGVPSATPPPAGGTPPQTRREVLAAAVPPNKGPDNGHVAMTHIDYSKVLRRNNPMISVKEGGLCPTGWAGRQFRKQLNERPDSTPVLGSDDQKLHDNFWRIREAEALAPVLAGEPKRYRRRIKTLLNNGVGCIIAVADFKSAGKTTDTLGIGSFIADIGRKPVLAMPATANTATSNLGRRAGIVQELGYMGIRVTEISNQIAVLSSSSEVMTAIPTTDPAGLSVISEDENDDIGIDNAFPLVKFVELVMALFDTYPIIILDMGNDNISRGSIGLAAIRFAHALVFATRANDEDTAESLARTVRGCNTDTQPLNPAELLGHEPSPEELSKLGRTGFFKPTPVKVALSTVIANIIKPTDEGHKPDFDLLMRPNQDAHSYDLPQWRGVGVTVPYEPAIDRSDRKNRTQDLKPFAIKDLSETGQLAFLRATTATLEAAAEIQGINVPEIDKNQPPIVVDES